MPARRLLRSWTARLRGRPKAAGPGWTLAVTPDAQRHKDGAGSQLHRALGIYALSRRLGIPYIHTPFVAIGYHGLRALEENAPDPGLLAALNGTFAIPSDVALPEARRETHLRRIDAAAMSRLLETAADGGDPIVARIVSPHGIMDRHPDGYEACRPLSPFRRPPPAGRALRVALHVRRGELFVVDSDRMLPNGFYIETARRIGRALQALDVPHEFELHTEVSTREIVVGPQHHGIKGRIREPVTVSADLNRLEDFDAIPGLVRRINEPALDCLAALATADILVMSRSSFSYVAAVLNDARAVILCHPFWHAPLSSWLPTETEGRFDEAAFGAKIAAMLASP